MAHENLYDRLAEHFNQFIVGAPRTANLIRILAILFPPEEAATALRMPIMHQMTLAAWQAALPELAARAKEWKPCETEQSRSMSLTLPGFPRS